MLEGATAEAGGQIVGKVVIAPVAKAISTRLAARTAARELEELGSVANSASSPRVPRLLRLDELAQVHAGTSYNWSSKTLRSAVEALDNGATSVNVGSRAEAEELLFGRYLGDGYKNTTGMSPTATKDFFGSKDGTYHWDIGEDAYPHGTDHLQVHTHEGDVVRIYFK